MTKYTYYSRDTGSRPRELERTNDSGRVWYQLNNRWGLYNHTPTFLYWTRVPDTAAVLLGAQVD